MKKRICIVFGIILIFSAVVLIQIRIDRGIDEKAADGPPYTESFFYNGKLYSGVVYYMEIPKDSVCIGKISAITQTPSHDLESTYGLINQTVYLFWHDETACFGIPELRTDEQGQVRYHNGGNVLVSGASGITPPFTSYYEKR